MHACIYVGGKGTVTIMAPLKLNTAHVSQQINENSKKMHTMSYKSYSNK